jgi:hypothetical protein
LKLVYVNGSIRKCCHAGTFHNVVLLARTILVPEQVIHLDAEVEIRPHLPDIAARGRVVEWIRQRGSDESGEEQR